MLQNINQQCGRADLINSTPGFDSDDVTVESCESVLVQTGVYNKEFLEIPEHSPRDFLPVEEKLKEPKFVTENVYNAIHLIYDREGFH